MKSDQLNIHTNDFRESLSTSAKSGKRIWIYPKAVSGLFFNLRQIVAYFLIAIFIGVPFVKINHNPIFLFDIINRKFILFGVPFWTQDFYLLAFSLLTFIVCIVAFTVVLGRIWCGWACPQTVLMEMVFRRIEHWIEGDASQRKKLDQLPNSIAKLSKKGFKHFIFLIVSFLIALTLSFYVLGTGVLTELLELKISALPLVILLVLTLIIYVVFARLREIVCIFICPYGRLQSVFLDNKSIIVAYDFVRGEPREKLLKNIHQPNNGDCVDCGLCVQVCPTGIDIRNGTQLECINCTACIDVCDHVMTKISKPKGLIRYTSIENILQKSPFKLTVRMVSYFVLMIGLIGILSFFLYSNKTVEATILRTPGMLYQIQKNGNITNLYNIEIINKGFKDIDFQLKTHFTNAKITWIGSNNALFIQKEDIFKGSFFIELSPKNAPKYKNDILIELWSGNKKLDQVKTAFISNQQIN